MRPNQHAIHFFCPLFLYLLSIQAKTKIDRKEECFQNLDQQFPSATQSSENLENIEKYRDIFTGYNNSDHIIVSFDA